MATFRTENGYNLKMPRRLAALLLVLPFALAACFPGGQHADAPKAAEAEPALCPECFSEISPDANRCPNCTSQLA